MEGLHNCLKRNASRGGIQFYLLIELLLEESNFVDVQARLVVQENLACAERPEYRSLNEKIENLYIHCIHCLKWKTGWTEKINGDFLIKLHSM